MKTIYRLLLFVLVVGLFACQTEEDVSMKSIGYLSLEIAANNSTVTKAGDEEPVYNPKQLAVQILDKDGGVIKKTDDYTEWENERFSLPVGKYTVKASSNGFDGKAAAWDKPYYVGSKEVEVIAGQEKTAEVVCTLANVLVTVEFDEKFKQSFKSATIVVADSADMEGTRLTFELGKNEQAKAYFPVPEKSLIVSTSVTNQKDLPNSQKDTVREVKARDNVRLIYKVADSPNGSTNIDITLDGTIKTYTFTIGVPMTAKTTLSASASAWSTFAYLKGQVLSKAGNLDKSKLVMEYKQANAETWTSVPQLEEVEKDSYSAKITGLTPVTQYQYRFVCKDTEEIVSEIEFTTEEQVALYNGNFDEWWRKENKDNSPWYAIASGDATSFDTQKGMLFSFWDSGNGGTVMLSKNPTEPEETEIHTSGGKAAKLASQYVGFSFAGKFAAGNIYTGHFCSANMSSYQARINFGQPFTSRPTQLKGWFKYNRGTTIDYPTGDGEYKTILTNAGGDLCSVYIALVDNEGFEYDGKKFAYVVNGDLEGDDPANFKYKNAIDFSENNKHVIAYGTITGEEEKGTGQWQEFTIDLKYRDLTRSPKYIIIVASASKYGDYFTGSKSSVMYVDDFSLIYGSEPIMGK